jgi:predicted ribosomally synthesized peptide with SipW-like signal peptide
MRKREKAFLSLLLIGVLGSLAGLGVFGAFTSTTSNPNNSFTAGTVAIADNDSSAAMYDVSNQKPGDSVTRCIKVTYTGSLAADVKLYTTSTIGALGQYTDLTITPGTQAASTFPDCTGFVADVSGSIFTGTLQSFASTHNSYANGLTDFPGAGTSWVTNDAVVYRFVVSLQSGAPDAAQGQSTGTHSYTWEARNQ